MSVLRCRPGDLVLVTCGEKNAGKVTTCIALASDAGARRTSPIPHGTQCGASIDPSAGYARASLVFWPFGSLTLRTPPSCLSGPNHSRPRNLGGSTNNPTAVSTTAPLAVGPFLRRRSRRLRHESRDPRTLRFGV
jgi:hypothetical protein